MYGLIDPDYPLFKHLNDEVVPLGAEETFEINAHRGANKARSADNLSGDKQIEPGECVDRTGKITGCINLATNENAWVIGLDRGPATDAGGINFGDRTYRKSSAPPTLFKGNVYFPIYQPPPEI